MIQEPLYSELISHELWLKNFQIEHVWNLHQAGDTVPFIARYRKEKTGNLDEVQIRDILELRNKIETLYKAKLTAIKGIIEQEKMTPELMENIIAAKTLKEVEEIYKPYKSKKKTLAMIALEKGFGSIAELIKKNISREKICENPEMRTLLESYPLEEILEGATHIIAAEISQSAILRARLKEYLLQEWVILSQMKSEKMLAKLHLKDQEQVHKFELYKEFSGKIIQIKPYQILALDRGENIWILSVKIEKTEECSFSLQRYFARIWEISEKFSDLLENAFNEGYSNLFSSVENEIRGELEEKAQNSAIETFQENLAQLLMTKPEYGKILLAIDPGFKAGCKLVVLDAGGNPLAFEKIFLFQKDASLLTLHALLKKFPVDRIVVWNGTGSNETLDLLQEFFEKYGEKGDFHSLQNNIYIVNESGASVYSASEIAAEEFPNLESLERGTVSLGRRYIDPLSELVKIPVWSIGVGMYQHDIPEKKLEEKLGYVVEDVVNEIGINVNTASSYVLQYISGINKTLAKKIYKNRPYRSREDLKKQLSEKAYEQSAWFLRVPESPEMLDTTDIHPEQYALARYIQNTPLLNSLSWKEKTQTELSIFFKTHKSEITSLYSDATEETLRFILDALLQAGKEKRIHSSHKKATLGAKAECKLWDIVDGIVRNIVAFGAFVDIGAKNDGLVHVSQIANRFISDPKQELEVGQKVKVKITGIDEKTGKIQLSIKEAL